MMLIAGENPLWVARKMGHKDAAVTLKRYARWISSDMPDADSKAKAAWSQFGRNEAARGLKRKCLGRESNPLSSLYNQSLKPKL